MSMIISLMIGAVAAVTSVIAMVVVAGKERKASVREAQDVSSAVVSSAKPAANPRKRYVRLLYSDIYRLAGDQRVRRWSQKNPAYELLTPEEWMDMFSPPVQPQKPVRLTIRTNRLAPMPYAEGRWSDPRNIFVGVGRDAVIVS